MVKTMRKIAQSLNQDNTTVHIFHGQMSMDTSLLTYLQAANFTVS